VGELKVVRSICLFTESPSKHSIARLNSLSGRLAGAGFMVQTQRLCSPDVDSIFDMDRLGDAKTYLSLGQVKWDQSFSILDQLAHSRNVAFNVDLSNQAIDAMHVKLIEEIIAKDPAKTFSFTYTFQNSPSSPFFPSATYERSGFAIGLQPTNLSAEATTVDEWLGRMRDTWHEIDGLMAREEDYLGIDTSIAPLFDGPSSFVNFIRRLGLAFDRTVTSDLFLKLSSFIKEESERHVGLCGLMFPCLEDFELADEYEAGNFSVERCLFLSMQSGLGLDAYPLGVDEDPERIAEVLRLVQGLANKHRKPLSARFISDGRARIGERTALANPYLKDVAVRAL
jgi:hypothetical protein